MLATRASIYKYAPVDGLKSTSSSVRKHYDNDHAGANPDSLAVQVLKKCMNKFDCLFNEMLDIKQLTLSLIGLLQQTVTWYQIRHTGGQAHYYSRTGTLKQRQVKLDWLWSLCFNAPVRE